MKELSIIIPHYNNWEMLVQLLDTIPTIDGIETIVIDDHSYNQKERLPKIKAEYPEVIFEINEENKKGAGTARNTGLSLATGKWLLFADSDDLFLEHFYETIEPYFYTDFDLIYFKPFSFIENSSIESKRHVPYEKYILEYLNNYSKKKEMRLRYKFLPPWSKLIRHSVVKDNNIKFEEVMYSNDVLFSAKVGYYSKNIAADDEIIYKIRERDGSLTSTLDEDKYIRRFDAWLDYVIFLKQNLSSEEYAYLNISIVPQLITLIRNQLGAKNIINIMIKSKKNNIAWFDKRLLNPIFIIKSLKK